MASAREANLRAVSQLDQFHVESWYPLVREHTFPTELVPISRAEAEKLLARCRENRSRAGDAAPAAGEDSLAGMTSAVAAAMLKLSQESNSTDDPSGFFVRLSTRSPKDAALFRPDLYKIFLEQRAEVVSLYGPAIEMRLGRDGVDKIAFTRAAGRSLRVTSAEEAMSLMTASQRVLEDVSESLAMTADDEEAFSMSFVVRRCVCIRVSPVLSAALSFSHRHTAGWISRPSGSFESLLSTTNSQVWVMCFLFSSLSL
jgi:hypothetical protein